MFRKGRNGPPRRGLSWTSMPRTTKRVSWIGDKKYKLETPAKFCNVRTFLPCPACLACWRPWKPVPHSRVIRRGREHREQPEVGNTDNNWLAIRIPTGWPHGYQLVGNTDTNWLATRIPTSWQHGYQLVGVLWTLSFVWRRQINHNYFLENK